MSPAPEPFLGWDASRVPPEPKPKCACGHWKHRHNDGGACNVVKIDGRPCTCDAFRLATPERVTPEPGPSVPVEREECECASGLPCEKHLRAHLERAAAVRAPSPSDAGVREALRALRAEAFPVRDTWAIGVQGEVVARGVAALDAADSAFSLLREAMVALYAIPNRRERWELIEQIGKLIGVSTTGASLINEYRRALTTPASLAVEAEAEGLRQSAVIWRHRARNGGARVEFTADACESIARTCEIAAAALVRTPTPPTEPGAERTPAQEDQG